MNPSILIAQALPASAVAILDSVGRVDRVPAPCDAASILAAVPGRQAIVSMVNTRIDTAVMDAAGPGLRVVSNVAVGVDNIDLAAARARGIVVTNTPDVLTNAVAEFTWALILAITRRLGEGERMIRENRWPGWAFDQLTGMELAGKTVGVVGAGRIGRAVAAKAGAFGMRVVFTRRGSAETVDGHPTAALDDLLARADVVVLTVPLRPDTRRLIDTRALARMKPTAYLVNTARGPVVDEGALVEALQAGRIAGAALDVFEREPQLHAGLCALDNVFLTPHIGSATRETRTAMAELAARNVAAVLRGEPALTPV